MKCPYCLDEGKILNHNKDIILRYSYFHYESFHEDGSLCPCAITTIYPNGQKVNYNQKFKEVEAFLIESNLDTCYLNDLFLIYLSSISLYHIDKEVLKMTVKGNKDRRKRARAKGKYDTPKIPKTDRQSQAIFTERMLRYFKVVVNLNDGEAKVILGKYLAICNVIQPDFGSYRDPKTYYRKMVNSLLRTFRNGQKPYSPYYNQIYDLGLPDNM